MQAQTCPGCSIDYSYTSPGLYPEILPPATAGEYYEVDLTFLLQEDTTVEVLGSDVTFAFLNYHILEPIGLPYGIHVTSNLGDFPVDYDPADGLFRLCPCLWHAPGAGSYTITVPLIATLEDPAGDNPAEYELSLEVLPPSATDGGIVANYHLWLQPAHGRFQYRSPERRRRRLLFIHGTLATALFHPGRSCIGHPHSRWN